MNNVKDAKNKNVFFFFEEPIFRSKSYEAIESLQYRARRENLLI